MKACAWIAGVLSFCLLAGCVKNEGNGCLTGAFLEDRPTVAKIEEFRKNFGKKPFLVLTFYDWGTYPDPDVIRDVDESRCVLVVTWEPWRAPEKAAIDYDAVLAGKEDDYIRQFAMRLKAVQRPVLLRFAHEMNGDWYPWAANKIGAEKYQRLFRHVHDIFREVQVPNVRWVFSVNAENVPSENDYRLCYPGESYVDYVGLDGYNWGTTQSWSRWRSFREIFSEVYQDVVKKYRKPVLITEFGSTSAGGDKARWIEAALSDIRQMPEVKGVVLFNVDKETDWAIVPGNDVGETVKRSFSDPYFLEGSHEDL